MACLFRDATLYLKEFIEYYLLNGVTKFYLGNNLSTDDYMRVLYPYVLQGKVELIDVNQDDPYNFEWVIHTPFYQQLIERLKGKVKWLMCLDSDEFIVPIRHNTIADALIEYEDWASVAVNWSLYGSRYHSIPAGKLLVEVNQERAVKYAPEHLAVKHIVRPDRVIFDDVHHVRGISGAKVALTNGYSPYGQIQGELPGLHHNPTDTLVINHYNIGTIDYYNNIKAPFYAKYVRPDAPNRDYILGRANLGAYLEESDDCISKFIPQLKEKIFNDPG